MVIRMVKPRRGPKSGHRLKVLGFPTTQESTRKVQRNPTLIPMGPQCSPRNLPRTPRKYNGAPKEIIHGRTMRVTKVWPEAQGMVFTVSMQPHANVTHICCAR